MLTVAGKNISIMIAANELRNLQSADILLTADLRGFTSASFPKGEEIIPRGYAAAQKKQQMLASLALNDGDGQAYVAQRAAKVRRVIPVPQFVTIIGNNTDYVQTLQDNLQPYIGKRIDPPEIEKR